MLVFFNSNVFEHSIIHRNGRWRSVWKVSNGGNDITGRIRVNVHYFEDGNVQLETDTTKTISGSSVFFFIPVHMLIFLFALFI